MSRRVRLLPVLVLALCTACTDVIQPSIDGTSRVFVAESRSYGPQQLDLLFIIDDTVAMTPYQDRLATLPLALEASFSRIGGGFFDTHIAVATTTSDELRLQPSVGGSFMTLRTEYDLVRVTNFLGTFAETFGLLAAVGVSSTRPNTPLETLRRIVEQNPGGVIRDNAYLGVVIVTASDDASAEPPTVYAQITRTAKADPANIWISAITIPSTPRLDVALAAFPNRHRVTSLVDGDYEQALDLFAMAERTILPGTCWYVSDIDPVTPGAQYDCTFTATIRGAERVLPPCKLASDELCWQLVSSARECSNSGAVKPHLPPYRFFTFVPPFRAECVVLE